MKKLNLNSTIQVLVLCFVFSSQPSKAQTARGVGSGIIHPAPNLATTLNPAALVDSPFLSFLGMYRMDPKTPLASLTGSAGFWGGGVSYREEALDLKIIEAGMGLSSTFIMLGGSIRKVNDLPADADVSLMFDIAWLRFGGILRSVDGGADRVDLGAAFRIAQNAYFEIDIKKNDPFDDKQYLGDVSFVLHAHDWTIGAGYDFLIDADQNIRNGEVHAGVSLMLSESLYADAHYRLHTQEWAAEGWSVGARIFF